MGLAAFDPVSIATGQAQAAAHAAGCKNLPRGSLIGSLQKFFYRHQANRIQLRWGGCFAQLAGRGPAVFTIIDRNRTSGVA